MSFGDAEFGYARSMDGARDSLLSLVQTMHGAGKLTADQVTELTGILDDVYAAEDEWFDLQSDGEEAVTYLQTVRDRLAGLSYATDIRAVISSALGVADDLADQEDLDSAGTIAAEVLVTSIDDANAVAEKAADTATNPWFIAGLAVAAAAIGIIVLRAEIRAVVRGA